MKVVRVCNITNAAAKLAGRLFENPNGIPVRVGWDGQQIAVFAGTYSAPAKSLPHERVLIKPGTQVDEIETQLALAVMRIRVPLQTALSTRGAQRTPRRGHSWRRFTVDRAPAGE